MISWETELLAAFESKNEPRATSIIQQGFPVDYRIRLKDALGHRMLGFSYPIILAIEQGLFSVVKALIIYNVNLSLIDSKGQTALLAAAGQSNTELVKLLVNNGSDVSDRDLQGNTVLHIATAKKQLAMVKFLIKELRIPPIAKNKLGKTPLDIAKDAQEHCSAIQDIETMQNIIEVLWKETQVAQSKFKKFGKLLAYNVPLLPKNQRFQSLVSPMKPRRNIENYLNGKHQIIIKSLTASSGRSVVRYCNRYSAFSKYNHKRSAV